jgi:hypothetical protein
MVQNYYLIGGPSAGRLEADGAPDEEVGIDVVEADGHTRGRVAFYRLDHESPVKSYHFSHVARVAVFRGGIVDGCKEYVAESVKTIEKKRTWHEKTSDVCTYEFAGEEEDGTLIYEFSKFIDFMTLEERSIAAVETFYKKPNYGIYSLTPGFHKEILVQVGHRQGSVDEGMVEVIKGIWWHNWDTLGSCQERPPGSEHSGRAYVDFPARSHGHAFAELLAQHNIDCEVKDKLGTRSILDANGKVFRSFETPSANVLFDPKDIDRVAAALNADS